MTTSQQLDLLSENDDGSGATPLPVGVRYAEQILTARQEAEAAGVIASLDLKPFAFRGYLGKRRTASFGWHYDFQGGGLQKANTLPDALTPYRDLVADFAGVDPTRLEHCLAIEYAPGAGIGWHRDRPQFGLVTALSLLSSCRMRFRREQGQGWERRSQLLLPRSAYVLDGPGRIAWEHSIPAVDKLRYSLTFRTLNTSMAGASRRSTR